MVKIPKCVPCISADLKNLALRLVKDNSKEAEMIAALKTCAKGETINLCSAKQKRQPSQYQMFISECMKSKPLKGKPFGEASKYMKECSVAWNAKKVK